MEQNYVVLQQGNKKKKRSVGLRVLDVLFCLYIVITLCYLIFCTIFIQAKVIGTSMQPTFNENLVYSEDINKTKYKDVVYANRFDKGTNGDIVIVKLGDEVVIKRLIATQGQVLTLKYESDGFYHFYLANEIGAVPQKLNESYIGEFFEEMDFGYYLRFLDIEGVEEEGMISGSSASIVIPQGQVFLLGDNRETSQDSTTYGPVSKNNILGTVKFYHKYNQNLLGYLWNQLCKIF